MGNSMQGMQSLVLIPSAGMIGSSGIKFASGGDLVSEDSKGICLALLCLVRRRTLVA